jgi:fructose-specific phosphotransferase system IIA component
MIITEFINKDMIKIDCEFQNKDDVIETLSSLLQKNGVIESIEGFTEAVRERESQTTTAVGFAIAIPHARSKYVLKPGIAIGRSKEFLWDIETEHPVSLIFLLAVPEQIEYPDYMKILASISRMLVHERFRNALMNAQDIDEFLSVISDGERYLVNGNNKG